MRFSPILLFHICSGIVGVLSGAVAAVFRKGSRRHGVAGKVFVISMLSLSATGVYMALMKSEPSNVLGGTLAFYLVASAWTAARRDDDAKTNLFDWLGLIIASTVAAVTITFGLQAAMSPIGLKYGDSPGQHFFLGSIALLSAGGDVRLLVRGGISGTQRVARHLWRMCFAFFVATASIFLAREHLFPEFMRKSGMLYLLSFAPLILMVFWLIRVRFKKAYQRRVALAPPPVPAAGNAYALR